MMVTSRGPQRLAGKLEPKAGSYGKNPASLSAWDQPGDMAHLAAGRSVELAVEVQLQARVVQRLTPFFEIAAGQISHPPVRMPLGPAQRQAPERPSPLP